LAKLTILDDDLVKLQGQLSEIVSLVDELQKIDTTDVPVTSQVTGLENVWREDEVDSTRVLSQESALAMAKKQHNGFFVTSNVFE
jgi:aspartyl-tRNA(Asn)/glutamyl-tRNA(Gln) amidotransferase subunit C